MRTSVGGAQQEAMLMRSAPLAQLAKDVVSSVNREFRGQFEALKGTGMQSQFPEWQDFEGPLLMRASNRAGRYVLHFEAWWTLLAFLVVVVPTQLRSSHEQLR